MKNYIHKSTKIVVPAVQYNGTQESLSPLVAHLEASELEFRITPPDSSTGTFSVVESNHGDPRTTFVQVGDYLVATTNPNNFHVLTLKEFMDDYVPEMDDSPYIKDPQTLDLSAVIPNILPNFSTSHDIGGEPVEFMHKPLPVRALQFTGGRASQYNFVKTLERLGVQSQAHQEGLIVFGTKEIQTVGDGDYVIIRDDGPLVKKRAEFDALYERRLLG